MKQAERLYFGTSSQLRRTRIANIANRYMENTAKVNKINPESVLRWEAEKEMGIIDRNPAENLTATRRQRMGLTSG